MVAAINLTPDHGVVGQTITIDGTGFNTTEDITLTYGGSPLTPVAPISTDGAGAFSGTFLVPASIVGVHSVVATDESLSTDDADFTVESNLVITESNIVVGGTINVTGTGFKNAEDITFTFAGVAITAVEDPVSSNSNGGFTCSFIIPAITNGTKTLVATDETLDTDSDTVDVDANITITESNAQVGDTINVVGSGFTGTSLMSFTLHSTSITPVGGAVTTNSNGGFTTTFVVIASAFGSNTLAGTDAGAKTDSDTIDIDAKITIDVNTGNVGDTVVITGSGYAASDAITVTFDGATVTPVEDPVTSSGSGAFTATIAVPAHIKGANDIICVDEATGTDTAVFTISPKIVIDDANVKAGDTIEVTGSGYADTEDITITINGDALEFDDPVASDGDGAFVGTFTVPAGYDNTITIVCVDETAGTANITFDVVYISSLEITQNASFKHLNGGDLRLQSVGAVTGLERGAVVDIPFAADDVYVTGGIPVDFRGINHFKKVYFCKILHNPIGLVCSFVPHASNLAQGGKIKIWGANGSELPDEDTAIQSKTLRVYIRGI